MMKSRRRQKSLRSAPPGTVKQDGISFRHCHGIEEFEACVRLEREVWKSADIDVVPIPLFVVAAETGGHVLGAFHGKDLIGFTMAIAGWRDRKPFLHSHMMAVRDGYRDRGVGRHLKLFQRADAVARGISLIEWTFDPLEIKNAYLNIERLGAIARRYNINQYGITSSPLQGGLPTDRLVAEWWLKSKRVESILKGKKSQFTLVKSISIPTQIYEWKSAPATRQRAREVQDRTRDEFVKAFADGLAVLGYERHEKGNGKFLLGQWEER